MRRSLRQATVERAALAVELRELAHAGVPQPPLTRAPRSPLDRDAGR